jgi:hypothetical protein
MVATCLAALSGDRHRDAALTLRAMAERVTMSAADSRRSLSSGRVVGSVLGGRRVWVSRQPVVWQLVPRRPRVDVRVALRPDLRIAIECAEPHRDALTLGPPVAEEARAADRAESFDAAPVGAVHPDQLLSLDQAELLAGDVADGEPERTGMLAAARAVAVDRAREWQRHLEADAAAETAAADELGHAASLNARLSGRSPGVEPSREIGSVTLAEALELTLLISRKAGLWLLVFMPGRAFYRSLCAHYRGPTAAVPWSALPEPMLALSGPCARACLSVSGPLQTFVLNTRRGGGTRWASSPKR